MTGKPEPVAALSALACCDEHPITGFLCKVIGPTTCTTTTVSTPGHPQPTQRTEPMAENSSERMARLFHEHYERLAPSYQYETRKESAVPWEQVPANNRELMIDVASSLLAVGYRRTWLEDDEEPGDHPVVLDRDGDRWEWNEAREGWTCEDVYGTEAFEWSALLLEVGSVYEIPSVPPASSSPETSQ